MNIKLIAAGDITKQAPVNTKDSIILGINTSFVYGIATDIQLTKDNIPISLESPLSQNIITEGKEIKDLDLKEVKQLRLGNKIQSHSVLTLEESLKLFLNTTKPFILNLVDQKERNKEFVEIVVSIIKKYPTVNLYVKSESKEIALYFNTFNTKAKSGIVISSNDPIVQNMNFDFYSFYWNDLNKDNVIRELNKNKGIMIEQVDTAQQLQQIGIKLGKALLETFIITKNVVALNNAITLYEKNVLTEL